MTQRIVRISGERLSSDDGDGALLVREEQGVDWTLLRTVTADDASAPAASVFTAETAIKTPFIDLRFEKTGGSWGSCVVEVVEVCQNADAADEGFPVKTAFKDTADTFTVSEDCVITGICARGRITVKVTSMEGTGLTELKVYARPGC